MKKLKEEKGITLVALIVTIVVLLILAIVSIGAISDSKIIAHAQNAAKDYNIAKDEQEEKLKEYETEIEKYLPNNNITKVGVKAYNFGGKIMIFTPENELYQYTEATDLFPSYKIDLVEVKIKDDPTYNITIDTNDFTQEEISKIRLVTSTYMNGICAYFDGEDGRDTFYFTPVASGVTEVTITKSMPIQHSEQLLAQYYQDSVMYDYFVPEEGADGGTIILFDYENDVFKMYLYDKKHENVALFSKNIILSKEVNKNPLKVKVDGKEHTITTSAKKIIFDDDSGDRYIENDLLYTATNGVVEGASVYVIQKNKLINRGALPIE